MLTHKTLITNSDHRRLRAITARLRASGRARADQIAVLSDRLRRSDLVSSSEVPRNVVTLGSCVALKDLDSGKRVIRTVVEPHDDPARLAEGLAAAGPADIALVGKRVGEVVRVPRGSASRWFRIEQVLYQPEAAGRAHP